MPIIPFKTFDECGNEPSKNWAIKKVIALDEDSSWFGPPGSLKSALMADICYHLAAGRDWRGFKIRRPLGCVYFAFERAGLTRRRFQAYAKRDSVSGLPIVVCDRIIDLMDIKCVDDMTHTIAQVEHQFGIPVGFCVVDTYAKGIAAGGGDENSAQHANLVAANMKLVHEAVANPLHIATIGHTGWNGTHQRGSSGKLGHDDLQVLISGDIVRTAKVVKGNDQAEENLTAFQMETISLGRDEDGEPLSVGILSASAAAAPKAAAKPRHAQALAALERLGARVEVERWREELFSCGVLDKAAKNPREPFRRLKLELMDAGEITERDGYVSRAGAVGFPLPPLGLTPVPMPPPPIRPN
jgi:hypothetical protein